MRPVNGQLEPGSAALGSANSIQRASLAIGAQTPVLMALAPRFRVKSANHEWALTDPLRMSLLQKQ